VNPLDEAKLRAQKTYNSAADTFDDPANSLAKYGERTVKLLNLSPGVKVLDLACGTGASAIPAAVAAGPTGYVMGIDLSENMLSLARAKAKEVGLKNVEFKSGKNISEVEVQGISKFGVWLFIRRTE
jgi:ubiquinone/menaquinone biosynthesis C-methylase UbiE